MESNDTALVQLLLTLAEDTFGSGTITASREFLRDFDISIKIIAIVANHYGNNTK